MILLRPNPSTASNSAKSFDYDDGPLFLSTCKGGSCVANIFSSFSLVGFIPVEYTT